MSISRKHAQDYAERVLSRPRSDYQVTVKRSKGGTTLLHQGRALTKCHASRVGNVQAIYMARALGVELPPSGGRVTAEVPAGVLYRAVSISTLDLRRPEARQVLIQLLSTAAMQRGVLGSQVES